MLKVEKKYYDHHSSISCKAHSDVTPVKISRKLDHIYKSLGIKTAKIWPKNFKFAPKYTL